MNEPKELELKYLTDKSFNIIILLSLLTKNGFSIVNMQNVTNTDIYFDSPDKDLLKKSATLRIRKTNDKYFATFKYPIKQETKYCERIELERELENNTFASLLNVFNNVPYDLTTICPFPSLSIINHRYEIILSNKDITIALSYDDVTYTKDDIKEKETMVEIELKEGTNYDLLNDINNLIVNNLGLIPTKENKYERGLKLITSSILSRKKHQ